MGWDTIVSSVILGFAIAYAGNKMSFRPELRDAVNASQRFMSFLETIRIRVGDDRIAGGVAQCPTHQNGTSNANPAICSSDQNQDCSAKSSVALRRGSKANN